MKVDPVVNNNDELFMANMTQINKISFLQTEKSKRQTYIKDLQQSLALNKQSLSMLALGNKQQSIIKLNQECKTLHQNVQKYYEQILNLNASILIEKQLRIEEKKFYSERILDYETNMIQLRKYLQDKEESFSTVVNRLKKYQDLSQVTLQTKLHRFSSELNQQCMNDHFKKLSEQRDKYKNLCQNINISMQQLSFLKQCFDNKQTYQGMQAAYLKFNKKVQADQKDKVIQKTKNTTDVSTNGYKNQQNNSRVSTVKNPNKQLIKLLKKQKLNNQILQQALNEAIQKNQQLIVQNNTLVQANLQQQIKIQKLQSKGYLLQKQLTRYDRSLNWKQDWKTKCDLDRKQRINQFVQKGQEEAICMLSIEQDMQKLSSFIMTCVPKGNLIKSSSEPNFARPTPQQPIQEGQDIQIQQI